MELDQTKKTHWKWRVWPGFNAQSGLALQGACGSALHYLYLGGGGCLLHLY